MRLKDMPLSAPAWVWLLYGGILVALSLMAVPGGVSSFMAVWFAAAFLFQFWTYAAYRGMTLHTYKED